MKKKILTLILSFALTLPLGVLASACTPNHTHSYESSDKYMVVDSKAYVIENCKCGESHSKELENYIIATPDTAQEILDGKYGKLDNKTIVFFKGTYGDLHINITKQTIDKVYEYNVSDPLDLSTETTLDALSDKSTYHYVRKLNNTHFVAVDGARFEGGIYIESVLHSAEGEFDNRVLDPIRNVPLVDNNGNGIVDMGDTAYMEHILLSSVTLENMNFYGESGKIIHTKANANENNPVLKNCTFATNNE